VKSGRALYSPVHLNPSFILKTTHLRCGPPINEYEEEKVGGGLRNKVEQGGEKKVQKFLGDNVYGSKVLAPKQKNKV